MTSTRENIVFDIWNTVFISFIDALFLWLLYGMIMFLLQRQAILGDHLPGASLQNQIPKQLLSASRQS